MIFVFGSNEAGYHGAGAAKYAKLHKGAEQYKGVGHVGNSYAIPTKDKHILPLGLKSIEKYVNTFIDYATIMDTVQFQVTRIGCGLAGFHDHEIAPLFKKAPRNCLFDLRWDQWVSPIHEYWGTFDDR